MNENSTLGQIVNHALTEFEWKNDNVKKTYTTHFNKFSHLFGRKLKDIRPSDYLDVMTDGAKKGNSYDTVSMGAEEAGTAIVGALSLPLFFPF